MPKYNITMARACWQYNIVKVEAESKAEALQKIRNGDFEYDEDWTWPEPDDEIHYPEDENDENIEEVTE